MIGVSVLREQPPVLLQHERGYLLREFHIATDEFLGSQKSKHESSRYMKSTNLQFQTQAQRLLFTLVAILVGHIGVFAQALTVNFDTQYLGTFATPASGEFGVWSNNSTISGDNIFVSFEGSAAGNFSAMIGGQTLSYSTSTTNWTYGSNTTSSVMSPSFSVNQLNTGGGFTISEMHGHNIYIEYGTNTIGGSAPPASPQVAGFPTVRYTDLEGTFVQGGSNNNFDITYINNIGAATHLKYANGATTNSIGCTNFTSQILPLAGQTLPSAFVASSPSSSGPLPIQGTFPTSTYVSGAFGGSSIASVGLTNTADLGFFAKYPSVIANAVTGNMSSPLITNVAGGSSPTLPQLIGNGAIGSNFTGTSTKYLFSNSFTPSFTLAGDGSYQITLAGVITAVNSVNNTITKYGNATSQLTITVAGGNQSFYGYLSNGNVNTGNVTLGGNGAAWLQFSQDFYNSGVNGQGGGPGSQAAPNLSIAGGAMTNNSPDYGQMVQWALGDLQELMMIGCFGNTNNGTGEFATTPIGDIPSYDIFQDKIYAYASTSNGTGYNSFGKYLWENSENTTSGNGTIGAVYCNPYDDRFANGVGMNLDSNGGTLTIQLMEIGSVPEPSTVALLTVAAATIGIFARRRRSAATRARD